MAFRLVAASNRDLRAEVAAGRFRTDLFYRVAVTALAIPAVFNGRIEKAGDVDWWLFKASKGQTFDIELRAGLLGSPLLGMLRLCDAAGKEQAVKAAFEQGLAQPVPQALHLQFPRQAHLRPQHGRDGFGRPAGACVGRSTGRVVHGGGPAASRSRRMLPA